MNKFLKLKSWQAFGLMIIMPMLFIIVGAILTKATEIKGLRFIFPLLATLTMMLSYYGWIWTAGIAMHKQYFSDRKPNLNTFKLLFVLALFLFLIVTPILRTILSDDYRYLIQLVGLAALFSFLYCIYFTVKAIRDVEKQRNIKTNSIPLDFILIWFLPIGIWIIQPRIFRILTHKEKISSNQTRYKKMPGWCVI